MNHASTLISTACKLANMSIATRIKSAREERGIKDTAELARMIDVTPASLYHLESGATKSLKSRTLIDLSDCLRVRPKWVLDGKGPKYEDTLLDGDQADTLPSDHVAIRHLSGFDLVDGPREILLPELVVTRKVAGVPLEHVRWVLNPSPAMSPMIDQGAIVLIDARVNSVESVINSCVYAYRLFDRPDVRKFLLRDDDHLTVVGHGKDADLTDVYRHQFSRLQIGGLVIGHI